MKKHLPLTLVALLLVGTIGTLWSRIHSLEGQVQTLTEQLHSEGAMIQVGRVNPAPPAESQQPETPFKLLKPARQNDHTDRAANIGVPWEVERAMIGGAHENVLPRNEDIKVEGKIDTPDSVQKLFDAK